MSNPHLISKSANNHPLKQRRHRVRRVTAAIAASAIALGTVRCAVGCWFDPIIFDPSAMAEHVQQVAQLGQQINFAVQEVQNQLLEIAHLSNNVAPNDSAVVSSVAAQLDPGLYNSPSPAAQLDSRYPLQMSNVSWSEYESDQSNWNVDERQALTENRQLENQVYRDMQTANQQVQAIAAASDSAPGETATLQAHNDLLAVASGEFAKLQTLKAARSRLNAERLARQQSELSFAAAERDRVRGDWSHPTPPTETVIDPFQN